ncbi:hypothetical protein ENBRE01_0310 [Enteropsectra breve]|nr:hypothetical protein ENBRE01_0310 [Enteropsectra breve]
MEKRVSVTDLNEMMDDPTAANIYSVFDTEGYIRLNMLYISPLALKHLRIKLHNYGLEKWYFTHNELVFQLSTQTVYFRGALTLTMGQDGLYSLELDFDPIISDDSGMDFLRDLEMFLKKCDACFFITYPICIYNEILHNPLPRGIAYLANRKR